MRTPGRGGIAGWGPTTNRMGSGYPNDTVYSRITHTPSPSIPNPKPSAPPRTFPANQQVGREVFEGCIRSGPLGPKARLLVTNQLQFLPYVDRVVIMGRVAGGDCGVVDQGRYADLLRRGHDLESLLSSGGPEGGQGGVEMGGEEEQPYEDGVEDAVEGLPHHHQPQPQAPQHHHPHHMEATATEPTSGEAGSEPPLPENPQAGPASVPAGVGVVVGGPNPEAQLRRGQLMREEERATGAVKFETYSGYLGAIKSPWLLVFALISFIIANATQFLQQAIISWWTSDPTSTLRPMAFYMAGVSSMAALCSIFNYLRTYLSVLAGVRASADLHHKALGRVLRAPMRYFDTTPLGQLLQRFSSDLDQVRHCDVEGC